MAGVQQVQGDELILHVMVREREGVEWFWAWW
jgi:hypothetical protein